jgi:hypothetical protein
VVERVADNASMSSDFVMRALTSTRSFFARARSCDLVSSARDAAGFALVLERADGCLVGAVDVDDVRRPAPVRSIEARSADIKSTTLDFGRSSSLVTTA